jgi:hypothetical protein
MQVVLLRLKTKVGLPSLCLIEEVQSRSPKEKDDLAIKQLR